MELGGLGDAGFGGDRFRTDEAKGGGRQTAVEDRHG